MSVTSRVTFIPAELAAWLDAAADTEGWQAEPAKDELISRALYLLRELHSGIPSPVSQELLDQALERLDVPSMGPGQKGEVFSAKTLQRPMRRRLPADPGPLRPLVEQPTDAGDLILLRRVLKDVEALFEARPGEWLSKNHVVKTVSGGGTIIAVALELLHLDGVLDFGVGPHHARLFRMAEQTAEAAG